MTFSMVFLWEVIPLIELNCLICFTGLPSDQTYLHMIEYVEKAWFPVRKIICIHFWFPMSVALFTGKQLYSYGNRSKGPCKEFSLQLVKGYHLLPPRGPAGEWYRTFTFPCIGSSQASEGEALPQPNTMVLKHVLAPAASTA